MKKLLLILTLIAGIAFSLVYGRHCQKKEASTKMAFKVVTNKVTEKIEKVETVKEEVKEKRDEKEISNVSETEPPTIIFMSSPVYKEHQKKIVVFNHSKHASYKCEECHHDSNGTPLTDDTIQIQGTKKCSECHAKVGKRPAGLSKKDRLAYHKEALHKNCSGCHRKVKKEGKMAPPVICKGCHTE
jgi:hypothetical protein